MGLRTYDASASVLGESVLGLDLDCSRTRVLFGSELISVLKVQTGDRLDLSRIRHEHLFLVYSDYLPAYLINNNPNPWHNSGLESVSPITFQHVAAEMRGIFALFDISRESEIGDFEMVPGGPGDGGGWCGGRCVMCEGERYGVRMDDGSNGKGEGGGG